MKGLLEQVEASAVRWQRGGRGRNLLVAVSGGVDSMVLLHVLHRLAAKNHRRLAVAHFNHHLRGRAGAADELLVRRTAAQLGLSFFSGGAAVKAQAAREKISLEMAARQLRHEFLARTARRENFPAVALAHHAEDQVELFFLRLLRGAGGEGLAGMKWRSPSPADKTISLVRPLLGLTKAELLAFAREHRIRFRVDASNFSTDFLRNRIRLELLPLLRRHYQPGLDKTVLRLMDIVGAEAEFAEAAARRWRTEAPSRPAFADLPRAVQRRVLRQQLSALQQPGDFALNFALVEALCEAPEKFVSTGGADVARDAAGKIFLRPAQTKAFTKAFNPAEQKLKLHGQSGTAEFAGRSFRWAIGKSTGKASGKIPKPQAGREFFDAGQIGDEIILRHWRPGDRFQPLGLLAAAKLQDLLVNAKIPAAQRRQLTVATTAAGVIFWVEGLRIGEPAKLTARTRRRLAWHWRPSEPGEIARRDGQPARHPLE